MIRPSSPWRRLALVAVAVIPLAFAGVAVGALANSEARVDRIPAAVVNLDAMLETTAPDGSTQTMFAGRQIVTDLTGPDVGGFDWRVTNADEAARWLANGEIAAVITIPEDFSARVTSLSGDDPRQAGIRITTDEAHDYLSPALANQVGESIVRQFGDVVTTGFVAGLVDGMSTIAAQLGTAADGAHALGSGATELRAGIGELESGATQIADGIGSAGSGAGELASGATALQSGLGSAQSGIDQLSGGASGLARGVDQYTGGVDELAAGIGQLNAQLQAAAGQAQNAGGLAALESSIDELSAAATQLAAGLALNPTTDPRALAGAQQLAGGMQQLAAADIAGQVAGPVTQLVDGVGQLNAGAQQLAGSSASLRSGAAQLSSGLSQLDAGFGASVDGAGRLASGAGQLQSGLAELQSGQVQLAAGASQAGTGASQLADGAVQLGDGLRSGAEQIPTYTEAQRDQLADVAANPIGTESESVGDAASPAARIATIAVPIALWLGALAILLVLTPVTKRALASTASAGRLVMAFLGRAALMGIAQAVLVVVAVHSWMGVPWSSLPATLGLSLLTSGVFVLVHTVLTVLWGRGGLVVSLLLLALQATATGGIIPAQLLAEPIQAMRPLLPMTHAVAALQAIITGANAGVGWAAAGALALLGLVLLGVAVLAVRYARRRVALTSLSVLPAPA